MRVVSAGGRRARSRSWVPTFRAEPNRITVTNCSWAAPPHQARAIAGQPSPQRRPSIWSDPEGLIAPSPAGVTFLGGVNDMPAGSTGYFTADLTPGRCVLISEVPNTLGKTLLRTFEVSGDRKRAGRVARSGRMMP